MMNQKIIKYLTKLKTHLEFYNNTAPFPVYDTDYVKAVNNKIEEMKQATIDYDDEPVVCCTHCKSLHITVDNEDNDICNRCSSINELETLDDIHEYEKKYGHIWK